MIRSAIMRRLSIAVLSILFAISFAPTTIAQCSLNGCGLAVSPTAQFQWRPTSVPDQLALYRDGIQVGVWRSADQKFIPLDVATRTWGQPTDRAPVDVPADFRNAGAYGGVREADGTSNFGIDLARMSPKPSYSLNGREVTREAAMSAVASDGLDDDSGKLRITLIGSESDCDRVRQAIVASDLNDRVHVKSYRPNDPMIASGFITTGSPTVYVQDGRGKTLHRQDAVNNTEQLIGAVREAERRRKPNYDPAKDPDLTKSPAMPDLSNIPKGVWVVLAGIVFLFVASRKLPPNQPNGAPK